MKIALIIFPGSNCDRDMQMAVRRVLGVEPELVWHQDSSLPDSLDAIIIPGGFSYGDYLRSGAIAAKSPIMSDIIKYANRGVPVLGVCNGFQILTEAGLLDGVLMRNRDLQFICKDVDLVVEASKALFARDVKSNLEQQRRNHLRIPIAHHDGNYNIDDDGLKRLQDNGNIVFRYAGDNPNGSTDNIAGICNDSGNVLGMMPHPERVIDPLNGGIDGKMIFQSLL